MRPTLVLSILLVSIGGCLTPKTDTVPYTGRKRPPLHYSEQEMAVLGAESYAEVKKKYELVHGTPEAARVTRVGRRLATATGKNYDWEFSLLDAPDTLNAFCLPGGKIAVFSGLMKLVERDDDLAVALSHEIAHAVLQHSDERMSESEVRKLIGMPTEIVVGIWGALAPATRKVVMDGLGLGYIVGEALPYSQRDETEADEVGLIFMQKAGYDLDAAPAFWRRMSAEDKGAISDSLSTHPSSEARMKDLESKIAEMRSGA